MVGKIEPPELVIVKTHTPTMIQLLIRIIKFDLAKQSRPFAAKNRAG
jgi:hypothetical protein